MACRLTATSYCLHQYWLLVNHDYVIKWKHFPRHWPFVRGIHRSPVNSPHKGQCRWAFMFSLTCAWINGWVNNRGSGDLRRHQAHYDVIVMMRFCGIPRRAILLRAPRLLFCILSLKIILWKLLSRGQWVKGKDSLPWRHNGRDGVSNHQTHDCLLNR